MRKTNWIAVGACSVVGVLGAMGVGGWMAPSDIPPRVEPAPLALDTQDSKVSYAMGVALARRMKRQRVEVDGEFLTRGMRDGLVGGELLLTEEAMRSSLQSLQAELKKKDGDALSSADQNRGMGEAFLAKNAKLEGVVTLPSGLQYKVLKAGNGKTPAETDTVECHYRTAFVDGTELDNSWTRGQPATFKVSRVIPGWKEALRLMPVGSKWQLFVPASLAYGEKGLALKGKKKNAKATIAPNTALVYEVELLALKGK